MLPPPHTPLFSLGNINNQEGGSNATVPTNKSTNPGSATTTMQQDLGPGATNLGEGLQDPPPTQPPSELAPTAQPSNDLSPAEGIPVETEETIVNSLTKLSGEYTQLLLTTQDVKSVNYARAMSEFNVKVDAQNQSPEMQKVISQLLDGEQGHWIKQYLDSHDESQHLEMTDIVNFLKKTCDAGTIDQQLLHTRARGRPMMLASPEFILKHTWPSLAMKTIVTQLMELKLINHEWTDEMGTDHLFEILATYFATSFERGSGPTPDGDMDTNVSQQLFDAISVEAGYPGGYYIVPTEYYVVPDFWVL